MNCSVYRSSKKTECYLFIENRDNFERVPGSLLNMLGHLEWVMDIDLSKREKLSQADPLEVSKLLAEQGYFLQMPPGQYQAGSA